MQDTKTTTAVLIEGRFYIQNADGSFQPVEGKTDWNRLSEMTDADIEAAALEDDDALPFSDHQWAQTTLAPHKEYIRIGVDEEVLAWFKANGTQPYQATINDVLRDYVDERKKAG